MIRAISIIVVYSNIALLAFLFIVFHTANNKVTFKYVHNSNMSTIPTCLKPINNNLGFRLEIIK